MKEKETKMIKRQDSLLSSSSRRGSAPEVRRRPDESNVGCMSSLFQLLRKYQTRRRKFLTFGKKQEQAVASPSPEEDGNFSTKTQVYEPEPPPLVPADPPADSGSRPALVARLMGLEGFPTPTAAARTETASEKRRKLLGALEKCDEDLRDLKKIIEALRTAAPEPDNRPPSTPVVKEANVNEGDVIKAESGDNCGEKPRLSGDSEQQPSPVSVLDEFTRSPPPSSCARKDANGRSMQQLRRKPGEDDTNLTFFNRSKANEQWEVKLEDVIAPYWSGKAMIESVEEVCRDISWGEKREVGRIGLALHEGICRDLIEEIVKELGCHAGDCYSLPFDACKRRLCF